MEWIEALGTAIHFIEEHLLEEIEIEDVANSVYLSPFYFQKGFKLITGYTIGEYIRNRRLYLAALEIVKGEERVIDLAYKYGYDTPESFTKAFTRFHGQSPVKLKKEAYKMNVFLPLQISLSIKGGERIDYRIEEMEAFDVIGVERAFEYEKAFDKIPGFWDEYKQTDAWQYHSVTECENGEVYGVSIDENMAGKSFYYLIAKRLGTESFKQKNIKSTYLKVKQIPALTWAKFSCIGPMPEALQALNNKLFKEWLPTNLDYEIAAGYNIEVYSKGDTKAEDYRSEIWIPVKKKVPNVSRK